MKVLKRTCEKCGKEITSLYLDQLVYNYNAHKVACENNKGAKKWVIIAQQQT